jgi:hypothetical protein
MKTSKAIVSRLRASALAGAVLLTLIGAGSAGAQNQKMYKVPGASDGIPAYARTDLQVGAFIFHTDKWAAIVFYRAPGCVPRGFNLLEFFDVPGAFACPLTVSGFELWENGPPPIGDAPLQTFNTGLAVPVWFVDWIALQAALTDKVLTMPELESLEPLKGIATTFYELLNPTGGPTDPTAGATVSSLTVTASGYLPDGTTFQYEYSDVRRDDRPRIFFKPHVSIIFRSHARMSRRGPGL